MYRKQIVKGNLGAKATGDKFLQFSMRDEEACSRSGAAKMKRGGSNCFLLQRFDQDDLLMNWMWRVREKEKSAMIPKLLAWVNGSSCYYRDGRTTQGRLVWGNSKTCNFILDLIWKYLSNIQVEIVTRQLAVINNDSWHCYGVYNELGKVLGIL